MSFVLAIIVSGLITGSLARLAIPGPDPMPIWLTLAIGLTGSIVGALVGRALFGDSGYAVSFLSFGVAMGLVAAYRTIVGELGAADRRALWHGTADRVYRLEEGAPS